MGKVATVTVAARGQGAEQGRLSAEEGARVILGDVLDRDGEGLAAALAAEGLAVEYARQASSAGPRRSSGASTCW